MNMKPNHSILYCLRGGGHSRRSAIVATSSYCTITKSFFPEGETGHADKDLHNTAWGNRLYLDDKKERTEKKNTYIKKKITC